MGVLTIKPRARLFHGHDWVYNTEIAHASGELVDGGEVSLKDQRSRFLGMAIYNSRSQIVARRYSRQKQELDQDFFTRRIRQAVEYRQRRGLTETAACLRLVWSESDGLPGVIVDQYGPALVYQTLTKAMDDRRAMIEEALREVVAPRIIVERNDAPVRAAEGMEPRVGVVHGTLPDLLPVRLGALDFQINLLAGQKTGFYLDQAESYGEVAAFAKGRRVLDCFSNQGAFALFCKAAGATEVTAVEASGDCIQLATENAKRNQLEVSWKEDNAFDYLKNAEKANAEFDLVVLDPPSFTRNRSKLNEAMRGYKEIHLRSMKLLRPGGILATFCCSHHVSSEEFLECIADAAVDARCSLRLLKRLGQAQDHPVLLHIPETEYLKGYIFELVPGR